MGVFPQGDATCALTARTVLFGVVVFHVRECPCPCLRLDPDLVQPGPIAGVRFPFAAVDLGSVVRQGRDQDRTSSGAGIVRAARRRPVRLWNMPGGLCSLMP
jgi:hypothetical protein